MDKKMIASLLRTRRNLSGISVQEVILKLKEKGIDISEKTLYGYESGVSSPNVQNFIALCDIYDIDDIIGAVSGAPHKSKIENSALASQEWRIDQYNDFFNADLFGKIYLLMKWGIPSFSGYEEKIEKLFPSDSEKANYDLLYSAFIKMNETGQGIAIGRILELSQNNDYLKDEYKQIAPPTASGGSAG